MDFTFLYTFCELVMSFVSTVGDIFDTSLSDILGDWSLGVLGGFGSVTLLEFMLVGGVWFIIAYSLFKWAIPLFE